MAESKAGNFQIDFIKTLVHINEDFNRLYVPFFVKSDLILYENKD